MYDRWQRNGLAAIPEYMDALQSQMRGADMNVAMLLTWNYMATKPSFFDVTLRVQSVRAGKAFQ